MKTKGILFNSLAGGFLGCVVGGILGAVCGVIVVIGAILFASRQTPGLNGIVLAPLFLGILLAFLGGIVGVMAGVFAVKQPWGCLVLFLGSLPGLLIGIIVGRSIIQGFLLGLATVVISVGVQWILERYQE